MILQINNTKLPAEVFSGTESLRRGLMHRKNPLGHSAALFDLGVPSICGFWMKNTKIPLDIIFVSPELKIIKITHSAQPETTNLHYPDSQAKYVIELDGGYSKKLGLKVGDNIQLPKTKVTLKKPPRK